MTAERKEFLKLIHDQREKSKTVKWTGTFIEYLDLVKKDPSMIKLAHKRVYEALSVRGSSVLDDSNPKRIFWRRTSSKQSHEIS